jgi:hypothetical protein
VVGSPFDRALSKIIGQPLSVAIILTHAKPSAPRLDIVSSYSILADQVDLPQQARVGAKAGSIFSADADFAKRLSSNKVLMDRLRSCAARPFVSTRKPWPSCGRGAKPTTAA